jgi:hypothetical protein
MFKVVILAHALISGWHEAYSVGTEFPSFKVCEAARPDLADDFRQFLQRRHLQPFKVESKCLKDDEV